MRAVIILMLIERLVTKGTIIIARPPVTHNHAETRCVASHVDLDLKVQGVLTPTNLFCRAFPITLPTLFYAILNRLNFRESQHQRMCK